MDSNRLKSCHWVNGDTHITLVNRLVDYPVKIHLHEFYELEIVIDGAGFQNLNGTIYPLEPGSVYFLTPIDFHSITPESALSIANLSFDEHALSPEMKMLFVNRQDNLIFQADGALSSQLQFLFDLLSKECMSEDNFSLRARKNLLEMLLIALVRYQQDPIVSHFSNTQIQASLQYLFGHFRENISLAQVAAQSGYTPNYFSKLFREICGTCFMDFLANLRLNYAKMLLLSTTLSTTEIAERSGFGSASGFFRRFQKYCGCTPDNFRKKEGRMSV